MLPHPPTAQWLRDVLSCLDLEKMCYSVSNSNKKFQKYFQSKLICPFLVCFCLFFVSYTVCTSQFSYLFILLSLFTLKNKTRLPILQYSRSNILLSLWFVFGGKGGMFEIRLHKMLLFHRYLLCKLVLYVWHSATLQSVYVVWKCKHMYLEM